MTLYFRLYFTLEFLLAKMDEVSNISSIFAFVVKTLPRNFSIGDFFLIIIVESGGS